VDPILEVDEKVVEEVAQKCNDKNEEPATPEKKEGSSEVPASPDPYYPPIIYLPEVVVNSGEEEEEEAFRRRAKLYRYAHEEHPAEWKERGTGEVKIMRHPETGSARIIMRREKTMRVGGRWKQLNLFLHRCAPTIPFCPGWTFAPTVGHRRRGCGRRKQTLLMLCARRTNQSRRLWP